MSTLQTAEERPEWAKRADPEPAKESLRQQFLTFARFVVDTVAPGKKYPVLNYRLMGPVVGRQDPTAGAIMARLQENRLRELAMLEELADHFKKRLESPRGP